MAPDKFCFNKFECRLFISKFSQFAFYLSLSLSVISKSLAQVCSKCCNHTVSAMSNVRFAMNGMYVKNNSHIYVSQTSRNRMSMTWDLYCCLLPQCEICIHSAWAFQSQQTGALTRMWRWCQVQPSQKECAIGAVHCKKEGTLLQPLSWCCVESAIHHK